MVSATIDPCCLNLNNFKRESAANIHITVADKVIDAFKESGSEVKVKRDFLL